MDKVFCGFLVLWAGAMIVGLLIALLPVILTIVGFFLAVAVLCFVGRLMASWIG